MVNPCWFSVITGNNPHQTIKYGSIISTGSGKLRDTSKHFCLLPFFLRRLSFSRKGINLRSTFWHEYPWIHSWIHPWYIFVDKTFKLINYNNTSCVYYRLHCRFMKYSGAGQIFLRGDACGIVLQGFCALVVQCARLYLILQVQEFATISCQYIVQKL